MKRLTLKQQYEKYEKSLLKRGVELPSKPQNIRRRNVEKIKAFSAEVTRQRRSEASKKYWRELKENKPELFRERIAKLQEAKARSISSKSSTKIKTPKIGSNKTDETYVEKPHIEEIDIEDTKGIDTTEYETKIGETEVDLDYVDEDTGEIFTDYAEWEKSFNKELYEIEHPGLYYEDVVISNFLQDVYERPTLNGSRFILNWIKTLEDEYNKKFVADLITYAKREGFEIDVKMLYEEDKASAMATGFMKLWYDGGMFDKVKKENETFHDINKNIRSKMDKEFQSPQYQFSQGLMNAIDMEINADEVMQNYD